jgi:hypothetical protein
MREHRIAGIRLRRRVTTTIPDQSGRRFLDLIGRDFSVGEPNRRYVGGITLSSRSRTAAPSTSPP